MPCKLCGAATKGEYWFLTRSINGAYSSYDDYRLCSLACLIDLAWELRSQQPKLSKSKQEIR